MQAKGTIRNTGSPSGDRRTDQLAARERKAGLTGMAKRLVVPLKPGNSGGGKGPVQRCLADVPMGESPIGGACSVAIVVISDRRKGDRLGGKLGRKGRQPIGST